MDEMAHDITYRHTQRERTIWLLLFSVWLIAHLLGRVEEKISEQKISHAMVVVEDESRAHPE
jgi:hypothetical protein